MAYEFNWVRARRVFGRSMSSTQMRGLEALLKECTDQGVTDRDEIGHVMAECYHETGGRMKPIMEAFAASPRQAARRLDNAKRKGRLGSVRRVYWRKQKDGNYYMGRGLIQITHKSNYLKFRAAVRNKFGVDIIKDTEATLRLDVAAYIAVSGMKDGKFRRGHKLSKYHRGGGYDHKGARAIVNGREKASVRNGIARKGKAFAKALIDNGTRTVQERLSFLGYPLGAVDGVKGKLTNQAIMAFRSDNHMRLSYDIDGTLKQQLMSAKPRDKRTETIDGLRNKGSRTIEHADTATKAGAIGSVAAATAGIGELATKVNDKVSESTGTINSIVESVASVSEIIQKYAILVVFFMAAYMVYQGWKLRQIRLEDHNNNENIGR